MKATILISEKTDDADNRSVLSSHGGLVREVITSENSTIELVQIASRIDSAMHDEISNDYDPLAKVKGLISDMITRLEEKASVDDTHNAIQRSKPSRSTYVHLIPSSWCTSHHTVGLR